MTRVSPIGRWVLLCLVAAVSSEPMSGWAQEDPSRFPTRTISYIQPFSAGVPADIAMRLIAKEAEKFVGKPIIVVNKPGAAGTIGVAAVAAAAPDGYTIGNTPHSPMFVVPHLEKVPYQPVSDFRMIMQFAAFNMGVIVGSDAPFKDINDLIAFARQNPGKLAYGTAGTNSMQFIIMEQIAKRERAQFMHVPFKATGEAQAALLGGHIGFAAGDFNYSLLASGKARLLMLFREQRAPEYPQTPVLKDLGYDFPVPTFICVAAPKGLPDPIARKLEDAFTRAMKEPAFIKGMEDLRLPIVFRNSRDLNAYVAQNYEIYGRMLKDIGLVQ